MADALLSPAVGGTMWVATAATVAYCSRRIRDDADDRRVPLMGVLGAFLFAAQMINFSIPGTGSSGHLGGGLLLAILLGPHAAFLVVASVLIVQALFFADGGLLALGCNIFNLGVFPAFIGYPLYRRFAGDSPGKPRSAAAAMVAALLSLQLGAFAVVLETVASGISALPLGTFALFMLPIHLAIGIVEGLVTAAIVSFVSAARPEVLRTAVPSRQSTAGIQLAAFLVAAIVLGGVGSWFASSKPDGLEWSIARVTGAHELAAPRGGAESSSAPDAGSAGARNERIRTSVAGLVGGAITLALALLIGFALKRRNRLA